MTLICGPRAQKDKFSNLTFYGEIKLDLQICLLSSRAVRLYPSVPDSAGRHAVVADDVAEGLVVPAEDICHHAEEEVDDGEGRKDDVEDELCARRSSNHLYPVPHPHVFKWTPILPSTYMSDRQIKDYTEWAS